MKYRGEFARNQICVTFTFCIFREKYKFLVNEKTGVILKLQREREGEKERALNFSITTVSLVKTKKICIFFRDAFRIIPPVHLFEN